jgi:hypothetical protein
MPRRLLLTLIALGLTMAVTAAPVAADSSTFSLGAWIGGRSTNGGAYSSFGACATGEISDVGFVQEHRCAYEFDISSLPAGATITAASLTLVTSLGNGNCNGGACLIDVAGYVGNGTGELADLTAGSTLLTLGATLGATNHDVTSFVTDRYAAGDDWAGFRLARNAGSVASDLNFWTDPEVNDPPVLTVTYTLPAPPTPVASNLPNAATANPATGSPLLALGFAALLLGSLGTLAFANMRRR